MDDFSISEINSYLVFKIGNEDFAVHASKVQRILEMQPITAMPKAHVYMKGVVNLMGKVLPVIDARLKLGMEEKEPDNNTCIIVLEITKDDKLIETGIVVDSVQSVTEIQQEEIRIAPTMGIATDDKFIKGMVQQDSKFIMLLDVDSVFSKDDVILINEVVEEAIVEEVEQK